MSKQIHVTRCNEGSGYIYGKLIQTRRKSGIIEVLVVSRLVIARLS